MSIKIVLPEGEGIKSGNGTRVYTDDGHEINGITSITVRILRDEIIDATITVHASEIENLEGLEGIVIAVPDEEANGN